MIDLFLIAVFNRLMNWGFAPIIATRAVAADADTLRAFLADPADQWRLATSFTDVVALQPSGERCDARLRLPFGARLRASMRVKVSQSVRVVTTELMFGRRTVAWATWIVSPDRGTTEVDLAVQFESRGLRTRLFLLLGGRRWIARRLEMALATLAKTSARVAENVVAGPAPDLTPATVAVSASSGSIDG